MKINLRKADALQKAITEEINSTDIPTVVSIGRFDDPEKVFGEAVQKYSDNYDKKISLYGVLYEIRNLVGIAKAKAGIDEVLTDMALLDKVVSWTKPLSQATEFAPDLLSLLERHKDLKEEKVPEGRFGVQRREHIAVPVISKAFADNLKNEIANAKRERQNFSDKLLDLNVKSEIELDEEDVEILRQYKLI